MTTKDSSTDEVSGARDPLPPLTPSASPVGWGWFRWTWRSLTSMRTAVWLLTLLALAAVPGSVLPQRNVASDPGAVLRFERDNPRLAPWLDRLGFFDVYASPWFAAIYILLLISMTGCVVPRCVKLWRSARTPPPRAPRSMVRLSHHETWTTSLAPNDVLSKAADTLRDNGFRVVSTQHEVRAERGYLREVGNLLFHLSLLVLLFGVAAGKLFGFEGRVALTEGASFANVVSQYDAFTPSVWTDTDKLEAFSFRLDDFDAQFEATGPKRGEPRSFTADVTYRTGASDDARRTVVRPNEPLDINETKAFLTGHGYAPRVTVTDGEGNQVFSGPVIFLPLDSSFTSDGVIKAPDALPTQLGFEGLFLPTAANGTRGPFSAFPDELNPQLIMGAYTGDLGMGAGPPQSVFSLDTAGLKEVRDDDGTPFRRALTIGETMTLPNGQGSLTFDGVSRFANFQIAYDPGKEVSLGAAVMLLIGLTASLAVSRRRVWVTVAPDSVDGSRSRVDVGALALSRREAPRNDVDAVLLTFGRTVGTDHTSGRE